MPATYTRTCTRRDEDPPEEVAVNEQEGAERHASHPFRTPWGDGAVTVSEGLLIGVDLPAGGPSGTAEVCAPRDDEPLGASRETPVASDRAMEGNADPDKATAAAWADALEAYFCGRKLGWTASEVPLEAMGLGRFEERVYRALLSVPPAVTVSYGTLAEMAGYPRAARAVGNAMAANPIPIVIPCHRVVRSDGTLGRYGKDPAWKPLLLEHEAEHARQTTTDR